MNNTEVIVGSVIAYAGDVSNAQSISKILASGWIVCDGSALNMRLYPLLYNAIGLKYNKPGDAPDIFRLPDYREQSINGLPVAYLMRYK